MCEMIKLRLEKRHHFFAVYAIIYEQLSKGYGRPIGIGDHFEINDFEARVVAICETERSFFGNAFVYTTFDRALEYKPPERKNLNYIIVEPVKNQDINELVKKIESDTGLRAYTTDGFALSTIAWFFKNTGIPISFGTTVCLGFLVGVAVAGQTFYTFILDNMPHFGVLKAMGASNGLLYRMMALQAFSVGFIGYGLGVGIAALFGHIVLQIGNPPFYLPGIWLFLTFLGTLFICSFSVWLGMRRIRMLEAATVFRG